MSHGFYAIYEGQDFAGKSTTMKMVSDELQNHFAKLQQPPKIKLTQHPGSTPLGAHIRKLVKYPETIDTKIKIDNLSRQLLYMVDTINFIKQILEPSLDNGDIVFADRSSFISAIAYGTADGLSLSDVDKLFQLITPPKANRLYILQCPVELAMARAKQRQEKLDYFERKPIEFFHKVESVYNNLITGPSERTMLVSRAINLDNIIYIDSTLPLHKVVDIIITDLLQELAQLKIV